MSLSSLSSEKCLSVCLYLLAWWKEPQSKKKLRSQTSAPPYRTPPRLDPEEAETPCELTSCLGLEDQHVFVVFIVPAGPGWSSPPVCCAETGSAATLACSSHRTWVPQPRWGVWWASTGSSLRCELVWRAPPLMEGGRTGEMTTCSYGPIRRMLRLTLDSDRWVY